jgi:DNA modification methylase
MTVRIEIGDCRTVLRTLPDESVHCVVTSPPYWGLRDYGVSGQIGLEASPAEYVSQLMAVFDDVRRVLRADGIAWINLGDSYTDSGRGSDAGSTLQGSRSNQSECRKVKVRETARTGLPPKNLVGIPWRVAFALQERGWYLRQRLPWVKRNPMPESTKDRPSSSIEEVFLISRSETYFYDYEAVRKGMMPSSIARFKQDIDAQHGSDRGNGGTKRMKAVRGDKQRGHSRKHSGFNELWDAMQRTEQRAVRAFRNSDLFFASLEAPLGAIGNDQEIIALDVATHAFKEAHFATFPPALIEPLIKAGCPRGGGSPRPLWRCRYYRTRRRSLAARRHPYRTQSAICRYRQAPHRRRCASA